MTPLERKMLETAKIARRLNKLSLAKISEKRYNEEYDKNLSQYKKLRSEIHNDIESIQDDLERAEVFFKIVGDYHEPWYKIEEYVREHSKYVPMVVYEFVKKILDREDEEEKRLMRILESYK